MSSGPPLHERGRPLIDKTRLALLEKIQMFDFILFLPAIKYVFLFYSFGGKKEKKFLEKRERGWGKKDVLKIAIKKWRK